MVGILGLSMVVFQIVLPNQFPSLRIISLLTRGTTRSHLPEMVIFPLLHILTIPGKLQMRLVNWVNLCVLGGKIPEMSLRGI